MSKPKVFVSSTFYDLKHIRSSIENFIETLGYESVLSEKGNIAYNPDIPLDESCYREVSLCDIYVLIVGGRYGSPSNLGKRVSEFEKDFYARYESITKLEYESAYKKDIPIYILIEKSVYSEYDTFKHNRENETVKYAHVDSIGVFLFIDRILNQSRNNPVSQFEKHTDIESWLRQQWAGLFQELIRKRKIQSEIGELSREVKELSNINITLKRYLEEIVREDNPDGKKIINEEEDRLSESRMINELMAHEFAVEMRNLAGMRAPDIVSLLSKSNNFYELAKNYSQVTNIGSSEEGLIKYWTEDKWVQDKFNEMRMILKLHPFEKI
jgi:hypothetical protein